MRTRMHAYNPTPQDLLSGQLDSAILLRQGGYVAWTRIKEGPLRPDLPAAKADLSDMLGFPFA